MPPHLPATRVPSSAFQSLPRMRTHGKLQMHAQKPLLANGSISGSAWQVMAKKATAAVLCGAHVPCDVQAGAQVLIRLLCKKSFRSACAQSAGLSSWL